MAQRQGESPLAIWMLPHSGADKRHPPTGDKSDPLLQTSFRNLMIQRLVYGMRCIKIIDHQRLMRFHRSLQDFTVHQFTAG